LLMSSRVLNAVTLILVMLVTGVFWGTWFTLTRSLDEFPADNFIRIGKTIISNVAWPMRILMPATLVSLLCLCIVSRKDRPSFYFLATAFIFLTIALIITVAVEVPIDNQIKTWTPENLPENWTVLRLRWSQFHTLRTVISILAFISLSVGVVIQSGPQTIVTDRNSGRQ
jgi:uncharacterized membrane protein